MSDDSTMQDRSPEEERYLATPEFDSSLVPAEEGEPPQTAEQSRAKAGGTGHALEQTNDDQ